MALSKLMKRCYGDSVVGQVPSYKQVLEVIQQIAHARRQLVGIWQSRRMALGNKLSSVMFFSEVRLVSCLQLSFGINPMTQNVECALGR